MQNSLELKKALKSIKVLKLIINKVDFYGDWVNTDPIVDQEKLIIFLKGVNFPDNGKAVLKVGQKPLAGIRLIK